MTESTSEKKIILLVISFEQAELVCFVQLLSGFQEMYRTKRIFFYKERFASSKSTSIESLEITAATLSELRKK